MRWLSDGPEDRDAATELPQAISAAAQTNATVTAVDKLRVRFVYMRADQGDWHALLAFENAGEPTSSLNCESDRGGGGITWCPSW
jgi:hypothetical protein